jgi:hypothetical protein
MGVVSVRFNKDEERLLKELADYFYTDKSNQCDILLGNFNLIEVLKTENS